MRRARWKSILPAALAVAFLCVAAGLALLRPAADRPMSRAGESTGPRLVLVIVIDQLRYDLLHRYRSRFVQGGFNRFLREGASFTQARYLHATTDTCPGHAAISTGTWGNLNGIVANEWYDPARRREIGCAGSSRKDLARNLLRPGVGEVLKRNSDGGAKVIAVSGKRAAAMLLAGPTGDAAYWRDRQGRLVSSKHRLVPHPPWVWRFSFEWRREMANDTDEALTEFAIAAIRAERLGGDEITDFMAISYSASDRVAHRYGPESREWLEVILRLDRQLARLLEFVDRQVGAGETLIVLTADHGIAPLPEVARRHSWGRGAGRISEDALSKAVNDALISLYGKPSTHDWVAFHDFPNVYLDEALIRAKGIPLSDAKRVARQAVADHPGVLTAYTRTQLNAWRALAEPPSAARAVLLSYDPVRSGHVVYQVEPFQVVAETGSNHGSHWSYDSHVPLMWLGPGVKSGSYDGLASPVDIAPTLYALLDIADVPETSGCILHEALTAEHPPCAIRAAPPPAAPARG